MDDTKHREKLERSRLYMKKRRENETPEQREKRLEKARNYMRQKRDNELHKKWLEKRRLEEESREQDQLENKN